MDTNFPSANTSELSDDFSPTAVEPQNPIVRVFRVIVEVLVVLLGVPGNLIIMRVYWSNTVKTSTTVLILGLAFADCLVCSINIVDIIGLIVWIPQTLLITKKLVSTPVMASVMITSVIAADRCDCICRPHRRFFWHKRGQIAVVTSFIVSAVMSVPEFVKQFGKSPNPSADLTLMVFRLSCFLGSLLMIAVCYTKVFMTIRKHVQVGSSSSASGENPPTLQVTSLSKLPSRGKPSRPKKDKVTAESDFPNTEPHHDSSGLSPSVPNPVREENASQGEPEALWHTVSNRIEPRLNPVKQCQDRRMEARTALQRKTTLMLFVASVVFLLLWLPNWILVAVKRADRGADEGIYVDPIFYKVMIEMRVLFFLNNAVNPFIYGLANRRFRKNCKEVLRKLCK